MNKLHVYPNNNLSNKFAAKDISNGSLNQITTTGFYFGSNITEVTPYIKSYKWCLINAYVRENSASIFVIAGDAMALSIYRNGDGIYSYYPIATKSDLNTWEDITSDCTLANGISIETFKVYKNTTQKLIKMNGYLKITSEQKVGIALVRFPSNIKLKGYQYVLAYNANTAEAYGIYGTNNNVLQNDTKAVPVMNYFAIPNVIMSYDL